jgi:transcription antitermination factor NusG
MSSSQIRFYNEPTYIGSGQTASSSFFWFALQTWPQHEKKVAYQLQHKDIEVFLPLFSAQHQWSDRRRLVSTPLFPGYLFVRITQCVNVRVSVLRTAGVAGFVGVRGIGHPIPDDQIASVHTVLAAGVPVRPHPYLNVGQRVRIRGGSLDGLRGILLTKNDDLSLVVSVGTVQKALVIRVAGYGVEPDS